MSNILLPEKPIFISRIPSVFVTSVFAKFRPYPDRPLLSAVILKLSATVSKLPDDWRITPMTGNIRYFLYKGDAFLICRLWNLKRRTMSWICSLSHPGIEIDPAVMLVIGRINILLNSSKLVLRSSLLGSFFQQRQAEYRFPISLLGHNWLWTLVSCTHFVQSSVNNISVWCART